MNTFVCGGGGDAEGDDDRRPAADRNKRSPDTGGHEPACEFVYGKYAWRVSTRFEPSQTGIELYEMCTVDYGGRELYTYAEGRAGNAKPETAFPHVCGEVVSSKRLASAAKLKNVYAKVSDGRENGSLRSVPLVVDRKALVLVFRTSGESLFLQLMPTLHSDVKLLPGSPLFDKTSRGVAAAVGNMFAEFEYVVNCSPSEFLELPLAKRKNAADRLNIVCVDARSVLADGEKKWPADFAVPLRPGGVSKPARGSADIVYNGVVSDRMRITDVRNRAAADKKTGGRHLLTVVIDDAGVELTLTDDADRAVLRWAHKDPTVSYSIMPRRYFDAKTDIVALNTNARGGLKRFKSTERLI